MVKLITDWFTFPMSQVAYLAIIFLGWGAILVGMGMVIYFHIKAGKKAQSISDKLKYCTIVMMLIFFDMIYTVLNFGWCRYGLIIFYTFQSILLVIGTSASADYISKSRTIKLSFILNCVLYILPRLALPDTLADNLYGLLGLIEYSDYWGHMISDISIIFSIFNILLLIIQMVISLRLKKHCHTN